MLEAKIGSGSIQAVEKTFELLEILAEQPAPLPLNVIADRLELSRNKAYRLLSTMCQQGIIERDPVGGKYSLGVSAFALAQKMIKGTAMIQLAHPILEKLAHDHDEAVYYTVMQGEEVVFLDMVDCGQQVKAVSLIGKRLPFFTNAAGKAMKALESMEFLNRLAAKKRGISKNIPNPVILASELMEIRSKGGIAVDYNGLGEGIISVAVAVHDYAGLTIGALILLGPSFRLLSERIEQEIIPSLVESAGIISEKFGYTPLLPVFA
ncbi:MAG TPA: IclR family transcriptional regulator [Desulfuromonadales bacterium]|nr:IclR family transcriptional regulator [Desulfuromonadales bacterium]